MDEILPFLLGLVCFGFFVAVVGHGMWVAAAWLLRQMSGAPAEGSGQPCPQCGARFGVRQGRCVACGAVPNIGATPKLRDELTTTARQLRRLLDRGSISQQQYDEIIRVIQVDLVALGQSAELGVLGATSVSTVAATSPPKTPDPRAPISSNAQHPPAPEPVAPALVSPFAAQPTPPLAPPVADPGIAVIEAEVVETPRARYAQPPARPVHPLDRPTLPAPPQVPVQPRRSLAEVVQSFMEESNIRWMEIIAAVCIVVSSVGLVWSLRSTLKSIPYFPAVLFTLFTLAFHGAGLYTLRKWNLQAISRVILVIAQLLVPLSFAGAIVMSGSGESQRAATDLVFLSVLTAGLAIFGWVSYSGSRELIGAGGAWPLAVGVLGCSASQVLIHRTNFAGFDFWRLSAVTAIPLGSYLVAMVAQLVRARDWRRLSQRRLNRLLLVLGIATFALAAPLALIIVRSGPQWTAVARLSPMLSFAAAAVLAIGLVIHRRTTARSLATYQTMGTAIVVLGGIVLLMLVAFTWPEPELLLAVGVINCIILVLLGVLADLPLLYVPAVACAALAAMIGVHLAGGHFATRENLPQLVVQAALMGRTSIVLGIVGLASAAIGGWCLQRQRRESALMLLGSTAGLAAAAVLISLFSGYVPVPGWRQDRDLAAVMLLVYAVALLIAGPLTRWPQVAGAGSFLFWTALVQALCVNTTFRELLGPGELIRTRPVLLATVIHGVLTAALALGAWASSQRLARLKELLSEPLAIGAAISLAAATPFILFVRGDNFAMCAWLAAVAALGWLLLVISQRWQWAVAALAAMTSLSPALLAAGMWKEQISGADWWLHREHLQAQLILAALAAMAWSAARRLTSDRDSLRKLLHAPWPAVDQVLLAVAAVGLPLVALVAISPHAGWELGLGDKSPQAIGPVVRGWIALAVVAAALAVSLWERITVLAVAGVGIVGYAAVWLGAAHFEVSIAVASAARWTAAIHAILFAAAYILRDPLRTGAKRLPWLRWSKFPVDAHLWFGAQPLVMGGLTILGLTIVAVSQHASGATLHGPAARSLFDWMQPTASYAGPLLALVAILLGYAVRERQAGFALGGAAVFQLAANLAFIIHATAIPSLSIRGIEWLQWNSLAAGLYSVMWLGLTRWITPVSSTDFVRRIATMQWLIPVGVGGAAAAALSFWAALIIADRPGGQPAQLATLGHWLSYAAVGLILTAVIARYGRMSLRGDVTGLGDAVTWLVAAIVPLLAASLHRFDAGAQWIAYHTLETGWLLVAAAACGVVCVCRATGDGRLLRLAPQHFSAALISGLVVLLAMRGNWGDPMQPWWSLAMVLGSGAIATALGLARRSQPYAFVMTALTGLAVVLVWSAPASTAWKQQIWSGAFSSLAGWEVFTVALVGAAAFWLWREIVAQQFQNQTLDVRPYLPRAHAAVACGLVPLCMLWRLVFGLFIEPSAALNAYDVVAGVACVALGGLLLGSLWDRRAVWALPLAYLWGLAVWCLAIGLARHWLPQPGPRLATLVLAIAAHLALTGQIWSYGANLSAWGAKLGVSDPIGGLSRTARWLPILNLLLVAVVCAADLSLVLNLNKVEFRVASAFGPALAAWGVLCLAQERRREALQLLALVVAAFSAVLLGWAQLHGHTEAVWMERVFRLLMVLAAVTFAYGLVLPRFLLTSGSWNAATRKAGYLAGCAAILAFAATLVLEVSLFEPGVGAPVENPQVIAIAIVLLGLIAGLISMALLPGRDPLLLTETWKQAYVYAAQATAALLFAHLYLCRPLWFDTVLRPYWPFILMGLAFAGVGAAELFHRWKVRVLAEPLERTGAMLPLLPVIGWWAAKSNVDYSLLLLLVGILYLALSVTRKSWAAMIAAAVAGNGALWSLLHDTGFNFVGQPQLWLIPPALSVLAAAQINRNRLSPEALTAIRYAATIVIYVSSTSEIVIKGLGTSLLPPMILLGLSVAGAFAGIALRVRAFLYLGASFTLLALTSMVWHASRSIDHNWPLWAFGIVLGVGILLLLVLFEKNKAEMHQLVARLRQWEQ